MQRGIKRPLFKVPGTRSQGSGNKYMSQETEYRIQETGKRIRCK
jgi:hypothetical protein